MGEQPKTINELKMWYTERNLPPERTTRFFIGTNYKGAKAFGIYQDEETENFIVYKNKGDGTRSIRYEGPDEAFAVGELYRKLKDEIYNQKMNNPKNYSSYDGRYNRTGMRYGSLSLIILIIIITLVFLCIFLAFFVKHPQRGYYKYNNNYYYYQSGIWYRYNKNSGWYHTTVPEGLNNNYSDYYESSSYSIYYNVTDFKNSSYYKEESSSSRWSSDSDWDWDSGSSWDSSSTDWDSDW